ncbi:MAG TPA: hypothetical protein DDZ68_14975 [Parvularcula sp.]|nr:hypothetical protein [Parvularcula sp.]HBS33437.1 hypothetical protein [Parvularcula sp.]HBS35323.1 hypothetical protein [Parvularcula sp.]
MALKEPRASSSRAEHFCEPGMDGAHTLGPEPADDGEDGDFTGDRMLRRSAVSHDLARDQG